MLCSQGFESSHRNLSGIVASTYCDGVFSIRIRDFEDVNCLSRSGGESHWFLYWKIVELICCQLGWPSAKQLLFSQSRMTRGHVVTWSTGIAREFDGRVRAAGVRGGSELGDSGWGKCHPAELRSPNCRVSSGHRQISACKRMPS